MNPTTITSSSSTRSFVILIIYHVVLIATTSAFVPSPPPPLLLRRVVPTTTTTFLLATTSSTNEGFVTVSRKEGTKSYQLAYRIVRPMALSSRQAAPIVVLHGGPSVPSNYLYPLEQVIPYRSIVFYDQLGCGKSDEPKDDLSLYSISDAVQDLKVLLKKLGIRRFHLYGQSFGGILTFEYLKDLVSKNNDDKDIECLSAILSSAPTNVAETEAHVEKLLEELKKRLQNNDGSTTTALTTDDEDALLAELFRTTHQCRVVPDMPAALQEAYANAGTVWRGTTAIADYVAQPPPEQSRRMPSALILRGEFDFISQESVEGWKSVFNTKFLRYKTLEGCSHHGLLENGPLYGDIVDSYFSEYD